MTSRLVDSDTGLRFASWIGVEARAHVSYLKDWKQVIQLEKDQMWLAAKVLVIFKLNTCAFIYLTYVMCYLISSLLLKTLENLEYQR